VEQAWQELKPLIESDHGSVLVRATLVLSALGRADEAEAMARRRLARYKIDWVSLETLIEMLWRAGKNDAAAAELVNPPFGLAPEHWHEHVGAAFMRAFKDASDETALAAFKALRRPRIGARELREMTFSFLDAGRPALELAALSPLIEAGLADSVSLTRGADAVARQSGEEAARQWLAAHLKPEDMAACARAMYELHKDKLLWGALPEALPEASVDRVWLLRAASLQRSPDLRAARGEALRAHFAAPSGTELYTLGRYLAGLGSEASLKTTTSRTRTAWALAVRAEAEGRRDDAVAWYGVALASSEWTEPERRFADQRLSALFAEL
jgi:hypothetical protein